MGPSLVALQQRTGRGRSRAHAISRSVAVGGLSDVAGLAHAAGIRVRYFDGVRRGRRGWRCSHGRGGSPFDDKLVGTCSSITPPGCVEPTLTNPYDRFYAWALVSVHASGNVSLQVSGFSDQFGPVQDLSVYDVTLLQ